MTQDINNKIKKFYKRIHMFSLPYFFITFIVTYAALLLIRDFGVLGLNFLLSLLIGINLWDKNETIKKNSIIMLLTFFLSWITFTCMSIIFDLPIVGKGSILIISLFGAISTFREYNNNAWERKQIKYLI